jgi:hypothetical protein
MSQEHIISFCFCAIGAIPISIGIHLFRKFRRYSEFPITEGLIVKQEIITFTDYTNARHLGYIPQLSFSYIVDGRKFTNNKLHSLARSTLIKFSSRRKAEQVVEGFSVNNTTRVYYDPANPDFAFIRNGPLLQIYGPLTMGIVFCAFGLFYYLHTS